MVVEPHTPPSEETVVVSAENAPLTHWAVVRARRGVVLAVVAVDVARLRDDGQSHAAAGGVRGQQQPVAADSVEEEEGHGGHGQVVGEFAAEHDGSDVHHAVDIGQRDHHHGEAHGHGVQ